MHKNPFVPTPTYNPPQPPLPPGPPPQQPPQTDYSAYWAAAAAQGQIQQPTVGPYANQWTAPQPTQPPRPTPEQSALYANYGYGGNQNYWQQQQQRQHTYQPPPPIAQPPPPPPQPGYNPYQPQGLYQQQHYIPQAIPQPPPPQVYQHPPQHLQAQPTQQYFPQQPRQNQIRQQHGSQHFPPAKRQRFDPPRNQQQNFQQPPQFQPSPVGAMPPPMQQQQPQTGHFGPVQPNNQPQNAQGRGGGPPGVNQMPLGGRGGNSGRGGGRGKTGSTNMNRGGGSSGRGGRGGMYGNNSRGGGNAGQSGGNFRNHARGGFGNRDRRGGSFNAGAYSHQQGSSFRGRYNRSGRHDGGSFTARDSNASSSKKEEPKRTVTDFRLVGLEIQALDWVWGTLSSQSVKTVSQEGQLVTDPVKLEAEDSVPAAEDNAPSVNDTDMATEMGSGDTAPKSSGLAGSAPDGSVSADSTLSPRSRIRIYFHTPVTAEDAVPIPHASMLPVDSSSVSLVSSKKGKRKRADDEDEDGDFNDVPRPEPSANGDAINVTSAADLDGVGRGSAAPSMAETVSEGDWLMAAIGEDEGDGDASDVDDAEHRDTHDGEQHQDGNGIDDSEIADFELPNVGTSHILLGEDHDTGVDHVDSTVNGSNDPSSATLSTLSLPSGEVALAAEAGDEDDQALSGSSIEQSASFPHDVVSTSTNYVQVTDTSLDPSVDEQSTDHPAFSDKQDANDGIRRATPLQATASFASTVPDSESQDASYSEYGSTLVNDETLALIESATQSVTNPEDTQDPPLTNVGNALSANRLSISYAAASRRIVINAEVVELLKVFRKDHRIEISIVVERDDENQLKGIVVEALSETTKTYTPLQLSSDAYESDPMLPPFLKVSSLSKLTLLVHLDAEKPSVEAKWVKSGDLQEWLKTMFGRTFWVAGDADGWEKKIEVVDPDPAPTIWTVLDGWATNGSVGIQTERQRFIRTHLTETDNVLEILLRLVRGERATPFLQTTSTVAAAQNNVPGPLLSAIAGSSHGAQQTHVSLAVLALFRMAIEYAKKVDGDKGKSEAEERMGEIIRCLPSHLLHKSLDGMFKEWKVEKKGGR